ncbi:MAG TPA: amidase family protein [Steroidobacteraceae bacterium]|nr:amidase family protein [Steroidobacteraceae bacterium]
MTSSGRLARASIWLVLALLSACTTSGEREQQRPAFQVLEAGIDEIQAAYASGTLSAVQLVQAYLDRIAAYDKSGPAITSIIAINAEALAQAAALDEERKRNGARGPLHGIPVLLKDNINTFDLPTTNGSAVLRGIVPPSDAALTQELRKAGAIVLGKAAMGEFAATSYNSVVGQTINPYNLKREAGGSSSGPGAAIAANFAVLAVGTDTSTSVRQPAAYNGIVGLRPTTGLVSRRGIAPKGLDFDTAGPMARRVKDVASMLSVMAVADPDDAASVRVWSKVADRYDVRNGHIDYTRFLNAAALKGARIGVVRDFFGGDPEIDALAGAALEQLRALGATLVDVHLGEEFKARYLGKGLREIRRLANYRFREDWEAYVATLPGAPKTVAEFVDAYKNVVNKSALPGNEYTMGLLTTSLTTSTGDPAYRRLIEQILPQATADTLALFERDDVDVLVYPYETHFAGVISNPVSKLEDPSYVASAAPDPATLAGYNSVGFPSIVVPMGLGSQGLPMALTFFGKPYDDGPLLGYAYAYEQASRKRVPPPLLPALDE